ncbi:PucR family transcriptional regulator ligand-binding domain-containing protein [Oscillospiraceae bacterium OttesenSCG-928-G22]|nr:PucR family transcriptional regulator ligand-binding domain-containing protein [Oscillospiraceae bacterium OttesenSCG-928-G22]
MPGISVGAAIKVLSKYDISLLAGGAGLERVIHSVTVLEVADWSQYLMQGGEFILTTFSAFQSKDDIVRAVEELSRFGAAAIAVHPGQANQYPIPEELLTRANTIGIPILKIPVNIPYSVIFSEIYSNILYQQNILLNQSKNLNTYLTNILLSGGSIKDIITALSNMLSRPVLMVDREGAVVLRHVSDERERLLVEHAITRAPAGAGSRPGREIEITALRLSGRQYTQFSCGVYHADEYLGQLFVWAEGEEISDYDSEHISLGLVHTVTAIDLIELKSRAVIESYERLCHAFYQDLISNRIKNEDILLSRAEHLGIPKTAKHLVLLVDIDEFQEFCNRNISKGEDYIQRVKNQVKHAIAANFQLFPGNVSVMPASGKFIVILHAKSDTKDVRLKAMLRDASEGLLSELRTRIPELSLTIGVGAAKEELVHLFKSYEEAAKAVVVGRKMPGLSRVLFHGDLGVYHLLTFESQDELTRNIRTELDTLNRRLGRHAERLLETLEIYLANKESLVATAQVCGVHPNTVKYRIDKIRACFEDNFLENENNKLKIQLLLKMRNLMGN